MSKNGKLYKWTHSCNVKIWHLAAVFILIPIFVWGITNISIPIYIKGYKADETDWLAFFGGYIGACITALITLYVMRLTSRQNTKNLRKTLAQNKSNHNELTALQNETMSKNEELNRKTIENNEKINRKQRQSNINAIIYTQEQVKIENLRKIIDENYRMIDYQRLTLAVNNIELHMFETAINQLLIINRDVEMCGSKVGLYASIDVDNQSLEEKQYSDCLKFSTIKYQMLVTEFIFISSLYVKFSGRSFDINELKNYVRRGYNSTLEYVKLNQDVYEEYAKEDNLYNKILKLESQNDSNITIQDIEGLFSEILKHVVDCHIEKDNLLKAGVELIKYKEEKALEILKKDLEEEIDG